MSGPVKVAPAMTPRSSSTMTPRGAGRVAAVEGAAGVGAAADLDDADVQAGVAGARLGVADGRDLGVGEDDARRQQAVGAQLRPACRGCGPRRSGAWYLPMWVSSARPLQSPIAYSQSWPGTRMRVVDLDRPAGLEPDRLEADVARVQAAADRDEDLVAVTGSWPSSCDRDVAVAARRAVAFAPRDDPDAARLERVVDLLRANGSSRARSAAPPSTSVTCDAERRERLGHLDADDAAAEDQQALGDALGRGDLAVGPRLRLAQPVDRRDQRVAAGRDDDRAPRDELLSVDRDRALAGERARPRTSETPRSVSHGSWALSSRSWMTSSRRSSTACTSNEPLIACAAPGIRSPRRCTSPGRSSAFEGMHA